MMSEAYICDAIRTPFGRYAGALASIRTDDLAAIPLRSLMVRNPTVDWKAADEVILGCANQAGEDNRNVARMGVLLAGLPETVPASTINRLCGSGMDAVGSAARAIKCGEADLIIAGGVESMSRAPFVMPKADRGFSRSNTIYDTTLGWRFVNDRIKAQYGVDSMIATAENVAIECGISREDQDQFAFNSQLKVARAKENGFFDKEIVSVNLPTNKSVPTQVKDDEHPRLSSLQDLAKLKPIDRSDGTVTAGNASGINDGACALLMASETAVDRFSLTPQARVLGMATAGLAPRVMGLGPVPATQKLVERTGVSLSQFGIIEINEAFAAQVVAVIRGLGLADDDERINPNGGAIALGHPLGASGARLATTAISQMHLDDSRYALCTMCVGVGQGISIALERVS